MDGAGASGPYSDTASSEGLRGKMTAGHVVFWECGQGHDGGWGASVKIKINFLKKKALCI